MSATPTKHLIIAGVTRAGTTSLYNYLSEHSRIQRSTIKETRFFLDTDELKRMHRYEEGIDAYQSFFPNCPIDTVRLEATPDYLYCPVAAERIARSLPRARVVFILREPIDRLISWRRYAIQNGLLSPDTTLAKYIKLQAGAQDPNEHPPQHLRALTEGRYSRFLQPWLDAFDPSQLQVINYRDLLSDPARVVRDICQGVGIDPGCYDGYYFGVFNESRPVRWPRVQSAYRRLIWRVKPFVHDRPAARGVLRKLRRSTDTLMGRRGQAGPSPNDPGDLLSDNDRRWLEDYYRDEPKALANMLGLSKWTW